MSRRLPPPLVVVVVLLAIAYDASNDGGRRRPSSVCDAFVSPPPPPPRTPPTGGGTRATRADVVVVVYPTSYPSSSSLSSSSSSSLSSSSSSSTARLMAPSSSSTLHDESLAPGIHAINAALPTLSPLLDELRTSPYFRLYSVDMLASCEYLPQELFECYTESCEIYPADDDDVPSSIRRSDYDEHDFELDGWARWDMPSEDYYDTMTFPEDYTGYDGSDVWKFIHERIGFRDGDMMTDEYDADDWKADFNKVGPSSSDFAIFADIIFWHRRHSCPPAGGCVFFRRRSFGLWPGGTRERVRVSEYHTSKNWTARMNSLPLRVRRACSGGVPMDEPLCSLTSLTIYTSPPSFLRAQKIITKTGRQRTARHGIGAGRQGHAREGRRDRSG
jgi:hypothetical protein